MEGYELGEDKFDIFLEEEKLRVVAHLVVDFIALELVVERVMQSDALVKQINQVLERLENQEIRAFLHL